MGVRVHSQKGKPLWRCSVGLGKFSAAVAGVGLHVDTTAYVF